MGILLIYFIGKRFYDLAEAFNHNKWLYAILSILVYYAFTAIFSLLLGVLDIIFEWGFDWDNNLFINLLVIPIGLLAVWGLYFILKNRWRKNRVLVADHIDEIGKPSEDEN